MILPPYATPLQRAYHVGARIFAGIVLAYLVAPVLVVFPLSFTAGELLVFPVPGWSTRWYENFLTNPQWIGALRNSIAIGCVVAVVATSLGTLAAPGPASATDRRSSLRG